MDWAQKIHEATGLVDRWVEHADADGWQRPADGTWNNQDLLGHLTVWSDLLIDEIEAIEQQRCDAIQAISVDAWNAVQVAGRRHWTADAIVDDWRRSARRVADIIERLPTEAWSATCRMPWTDRPVSIADLLRLWLMHIEQHRARLLV